MTEFKESGLVFTFDDRWIVYQLDKEADYKKICDKVPETKCIDFIALDESSGTLLFIEVKGFRGYGKKVSVQERLTGKNDNITVEIAQKVRDSLAIVIGGARNSTHRVDIWKKCTEHIGNNQKMKIIAWLEIDTPTEIMLNRAKVNMSVKRKELRKRLLWLTSDIDVLNIHSYNKEIQGIEVAIIDPQPFT